MTVFRTADDVINQKIFEKSIDLLMVTDQKGFFLRVSPSARVTLGYDPVEMIGRSAEHFIHPADLENTRQMMREQRLQGVTRHFNCHYVHRKGNVVLLTWTGVWSPEEAQHFFIGRDITDARAAEQYREISRELENVMASIENLGKQVETHIED